MPPCRRTHSARGQVVRRAPFAPSPCSRGVASETRGCGGLVPRKAFSFRNFGQRQGEAPLSWAEATAERQAKQSRAGRKPRPKGRRSTAELGGSHGQRQAKHRRASVTCAKAGGGRPERFVKAVFCLYESFWIPLAALPKNTLCPGAGGKARAFCAVPLLPRRRK